MLWRILWRTNPLLLAVMVACAGTPRVVRVETEQGKAVIHIPRTSNVQPVEVEEEEFQQAIKKLVPTGPGEPWDGTLTKTDLETAERYRVWCQQAHDFYGDCLGGALVGGRYLDMQGRYVWALAMSKSPVLDEMKNALGDMVNVQALLSAAIWWSPCPSVFSDLPTM